MTKEQEAKATLNICVFCGRSLSVDVKVCPACKDYDGIVPARRCPSCSLPVDVVVDECPACGAEMEE